MSFLKNKKQHPKIFPEILDPIYEEGICMEERKEDAVAISLPCYVNENTRQYSHQNRRRAIYTNYSVINEIFIPLLRRLSYPK